MNYQSKSLSYNPIEVIGRILTKNWYWFVLSVIVATSIGYIYTTSVTNEYSASGEILMKTNGDTNGGPISQSEVFSELGINNNVNSLENEIVIMKSSQLLKKLVNALDLTTEYSVKPKLRRVYIYKTNPIAVDWIERPNSSLTTQYIRIMSTTEYKISKSNDFSDAQQAAFGDTIVFNNAKFKVETTESFGNSYMENDIKVDLKSPELCASMIASRLAIQRTNLLTGSISITVRDYNPQRAIDIVNSLIEEYNKETVIKKNQISQNTSKFIAERIAMIYSDLNSANTELAGIKVENNVVNIADVSTNAYESRSHYQEKIEAINQQTSLISIVAGEFSKENGDNYEIIAPNKIFSDIGIASQIDQYNKLVTKYNELKRNSGGNNPILLRIEEQISTLNKNTQIAVKNITSNLANQRAVIESELSGIDQQIASLPQKEMVVKDIMREQSIKEQLYLYLLNKREKSELQLAITEPNATIIEPARGSSVPLTPNVPFAILVSLFIGFMIPSVILCASVFTDNKVYTKKDIEASSNLPVLGILPCKSKEQTNVEAIVNDTSRDPLTEGFRVIRSNIDFFSTHNKESKAQVIQVTSTTPGEGKTFISHNLALSFAFTDKKVLLIDLDLRKGGLSKVFKISRKGGGASSYLSGKCNDLNEIIIPSENSKCLDILPVGALPPNPVFLLMSDNFSRMIEELKTKYDYIIIDSAPYMAVADSQIINHAVADVTIWVMRSGLVDRSVINDINELNDDNKIKNLTILLNAADIKNKRYGYRYGYNYGYGYGYGYEQKQK